MAVAIRLRREGAKNNPYYKIIVADQRSPRDGRIIEFGKRAALAQDPSSEYARLLRANRQEELA